MSYGVSVLVRCETEKGFFFRRKLYLPALPCFTQTILNLNVGDDYYPFFLKKMIIQENGAYVILLVESAASDDISAILENSHGWEKEKVI